MNFLRFAMLAIFLGVAAATVLADDSEIVVNSSVKGIDISTSELRDIFSGARTSLSSGAHIVPVTLKDGATHEAFLKEHIGKSDSAFRATWRNLVFTGQASMPRSFDTEAALLEYVAATPGAIGYASKNAKHDNVKTLAVK